MTIELTPSFCDFTPEAPRPKPEFEDCLFYHAMDFPNGTYIPGLWDIRKTFSAYIGNYPIKGKTVLDVGTTSGFLAFAAEKAGAIVTATDALRASEFDRVPFKDSLYDVNRTEWVKQTEDWYTTLKNAFWYAWHEYKSNVEVVYAPLAQLPYWNRRFDVVTAGAILEHLANPIMAIGNLAGLANEAVIIAFTPVEDSDEEIMRTAVDWSKPENSITFWTLSRGLYRRVFENLGFDVQFVTTSAALVGVTYERPTIIARRV